jgi:hypothetical protein
MIHAARTQNVEICSDQHTVQWFQSEGTVSSLLTESETSEFDIGLS